MIDTTFTVTEAEYCEAMSLFLPLRRGLSGWLRFAIIAVLVLSFGYLLLDRSLAFSTFVMLLVLALIPVLIDALLPGIRRRSARRGFRSLRTTLTNVHVRLDNTGYEANGPMLRAAEFPWNQFTRWQEGDSIFLLRRGKSMYILPKAAFSAAETARLSALLQSNIGTNGRRGAAAAVDA